MFSRTPALDGHWGTKDFIEYWAANQVADSLGNPYDPAQIHAVELLSGRTDSVPLMMWNPPWLLVLMRPVLQRPLERAAAMWMGVNIVMATAACLLIASGYRRARLEAIDLIPAAMAGVLSVPTALTIQLGQVSLVLLLGMALLYWSMRWRHDLLAGVALALLSIKPHLFLLVLVLVAIEVVRARRWRIVTGAVTAMMSLLMVTMLHWFSALPWWIQGVSTPLAGAPPAITWRTPNLPNLLRDLLTPAGGPSPTWPLTAIPFAAAVLCALWVWRRPRDQSLDALLPMVLCVSVIAAPFGWTFDHVVLLVPQIIIFLRAFAEVESAARRWALVVAILLCQLGLVLILTAPDADYSRTWWFPPAILATWWLSSIWSRASGRILSS